jgi:lipopolysaccharide/colanic/teichoic acid biosynthesis glycosyltransferase
LRFKRSKDKAAFNGSRDASHASDHPWNDQGTGLVSEEVFARRLCFERKRAERSRETLLLALVAGEKLFHSQPGDSILRKMVPGLLSSTRETDISGWYKSDSVLGILFTTLDHGNRNSIADAILARINSVLSANLDSEQFKKICISLNFFPEDWDARDPAQPISPELYPDLFQNGSEKTGSRLLKRAMDIAGSVIGLIILSPLFALTALLIRLTSKGPIVFRQKRVGQYGVTFDCLKFRSMKAMNDPGSHKEYVQSFIRGTADLKPTGPNGNAVYKLTDDPRVTCLGRFLRRSSVDELPQLWNVLKGEMSLVGPRPPVLYEVSHYDTWHRRRLLEAKPGITGLWQVNGRSKTSFDEMVRLDLKYSKTWSLWLDLKILLRTPWTVLLGEGAY